MESIRYRTHPRVYQKKNPDPGEKEITLRAAVAVGILAAVFVKGMFWGYMLKKHRG